MPQPNLSDTAVRIGRLIREARTRQKLSQEELADRCNVDPKSVSLTELGKTIPSLPTLLVFFRELKLPLSAIEDDEAVMKPEDRAALERDFSSKAKQMSDRQLRLCINIMEAVLSDC